MNRHSAFSVLLAFLSLVGIAREALAQESLVTLVKHIQPAVVTVIAYDEKGRPLQQGSGFFVTTAGQLFTNRHVLYGASRAEVKTHDGTRYAVTRVVAEDKEGDLVQVVTDIPQAAVPALHISGVVPEVGERVVVVGSPLGLEQTVSEGIVSAVRDIPGFGTIVQITAPISPGSSGSPVVNLKGEVIGIATLQLVQGQNLNFAIPGARALALTPGKGRTLAEWTAGVPKKWSATAESLYLKGRNFLWMEDYAKALPYCAEAVKKNPRYAEAWLCVGICNVNLEGNQEALKAFQQVIRLKPDDANAHFGLGGAYSNLGRWQDAVAAYQQAIRLKPAQAAVYVGLGWAYDALGRGQEAIEAFKQAIRLKPDYADAYYSLGRSYSSLSRWQDAVAAFQKAIRLKPNYALAYCTLGWTYNQLGRYQEAVEAHKQAIRLKPDYAEAHYNLGMAYGSLSRWQDAVAAFQQAIRLKPDYVEAHFGLGGTYVILGDRGSALQEYTILKTLDPTLANALFSLIYQ